MRKHEATHGGIRLEGRRNTLGERMVFVRRNILDLIFGYDYFISHATDEGGLYARKLARALRDNDFECFCNDFQYGENWHISARLALRRTKVLLVILSPAVGTSTPVLQEVTTFATSGRRVIPIEIAETLRLLPRDHGLRALFSGETIAAREPLSSLLNGPSEPVLQNVMRSYEGTRQVRRRERWFRAIALLMFLLTAIAIWQAVSATLQSRVSESRRLAALAQYLREDRLDLALLLAVEATEMTRTEEAWTALIQSLGSQVVRVLHGHDGPVTSVSFTEDGGTLVSLGGAQRSSEGTGARHDAVVLWSADTLMKRVQSQSRSHLRVLSADGNVAIGPGPGGVISAASIDLQNGSIRERPVNAVAAICFWARLSQDGRLLAVETSRGLLHFDLRSWLTGMGSNGIDETFDLAPQLDPDQHSVLDWGQSRLFSWPGGGIPIGPVTTRGDGEIQSVSWDGGEMLLELEDGVEERIRLEGLSASIDFFDSGRGLVVLDDYELRTVRRGGTWQELRGASAGFLCVAASPISSLVAAGGSNGTITVWDLAQSPITRTLDVQDVSAFSFAGNAMLLLDEKGTVWKVEPGNQGARQGVHGHGIEQGDPLFRFLSRWSPCGRRYCSTRGDL